MSGLKSGTMAFAMVVGLAAAVLPGTPAAAVTVGAAQPVPGLAALNAGGSARVVKVDCVTTGNCAATGTYRDAGGHTQVWAAFEVNGTWRRATTIPGLNALNQGGNAAVAGVSCAEAGDCVAGGSYSDNKHNNIPWVAESVAGTWGNANPRLTASLIDVDNRTTQNIAGVTAVSCGTPGHCLAAVSIPVLVTGPNGQPTSMFPQVYFTEDVNTTWNTPQPALVFSDLAVTPSVVDSLSCGRAEPAAPFIHCGVSAHYSDSAGHEHAAVDFPSFEAATATWTCCGLADVLTPFYSHLVPPNSTGPADATVITCRPSAFCSWGGFYTDTQGHEQPFIGSEDGGLGEDTKTVPGILPLNTLGVGKVNDLSCSAPTDCAVAGSYWDTTPRSQAFVDADTGVGWADAQPIQGIVNLPQSTAVAVSCPPPANGGCVAGGSYRDTGNHTQAYISDQNAVPGTTSFGSFGGARQVAGNLNTGGNASVTSVSCGTGTDCAIAGFYTDAAGHQQGFIAKQTQ